MSSAVRFSVLGPVTAAVDGRPIDLGRPQAKAVLARLLLARGKDVPAAVLIDELWGGGSTPGAARVLQSRLSELRATFRREGVPQLVVRSADGYRVPLATTDLDAARFEELIRAGRVAGEEGDLVRSVEMFAAADALWRAEPYPELPDVPAAREEASLLSELRASAVESRAEAELALGRHAQVIAGLERWTVAFPLRERLWQTWMRALYLSDRQAEALQVYQRLRALLIEELGVEPSPATAALHAAILRQDPNLHRDGRSSSAPARSSDDHVDWRPPPVTLTSAASPTPLFGRAEELDRLTNWWRRTQAGEAAAAVIHGDAGMGKTRLVAELVRHVTEDDAANVLVGECHPRTALPFQPFLQMLAQQSRLALVQRSLRDAAVPPPHHAQGTRLAADVRRYAWMDAVIDGLIETASARDLLLIVEDLHWADSATLQLLAHALRRLAKTRSLLVLTHRLGQAPPTLDALLTESRRILPVHEVALSGLGVPATGQLMDYQLGHEATTDAAAAVQRRSGGNPLFIAELTRHIAARAGSDSRSWVERGTLTVSEVPSSVTSIIDQHLAVVSPSTLKLLRIAAVIGTLFPLPLLADVAACTVDEALASAEEATRASLVAEVTDEDDIYGFGHELIREALLTQLTGGRRRRLHLDIAARLRMTSLRDPDANLALVAHHLSQAGASADPDELRQVATRAAEVALGRFAYEQASSLYEVALDAARRADSAPAGYLRLQLDFAWSLLQHNEAQAQAAYQQAVEVARELDDASGFAEAVLGAYGGVLNTLIVSRPLHVDLLEEALQRLGAGFAPLRARVMAHLARELYTTFDVERCDALWHKAVDLARRLGDDDVTAAVLAAYVPRLDLSESILVTQELLTLAHRHPSGSAQFLVHRAALDGYLQQGDLAGFDAAVGSLDAVRQRTNHPQLTWHLRCLQAARSIHIGDVTDADTAAHEARSLGQQLQGDAAVAAYARYAVQRDMILRLQGRPHPQAPRDAVAFAELIPEMADHLRAAAALALAELGRHTDALHELEQLPPAAFTLAQPTPTTLDRLVRLSLTCYLIRDSERAAQLFNVLLPFAETTVTTANAGLAASWGSTSRYLALLAQTMKDPQRAERHARAAIRLNDVSGAAGWRAYSEADLADIIYGSREAGEQPVRRLRASALETATRLQITGLLARLQEPAL